MIFSKIHLICLRIANFFAPTTRWHCLRDSKNGFKTFQNKGKCVSEFFIDSIFSDSYVFFVGQLIFCALALCILLTCTMSFDFLTFKSKKFQPIRAKSDPIRAKNFKSTQKKVSLKPYKQRVYDFGKGFKYRQNFQNNKLSVC